MTSDRRAYDERRVRLMRESLVNCSDFIVSGAIAVLLVPIMLHRLGAETYGLWAAGLALGGMAAVLDLGLKWSVTREVAAAENGDPSGRTRLFVRAAGGVYAAVGLAGGALIAASAWPLRGRLHLSAENERLAPIVFGFLGLAFIADQLAVFAAAVLAGLRRFDLANGAAIAAAVMRGGGIFWLLGRGAGLPAVAAWHAASAMLEAVAAIAAVALIRPGYRFGLVGFQWSALRPHAPSALGAFLIVMIGAVYWQLPQLLVGIVGGAVWIAQYQIAQKFPLIILSLSGRAAGALFPAASQDRTRLREVLETGTRWLAVLALPLCVVLWILAPDLLLLWLGQAPSETARVLRMTAAAVFLNALSVASLEVLWGAGLAKTVVWILAAFTLANLSLGLFLLKRLGLPGAAWGLLLTMSGSSFALIYSASRACAVAWSGLILETFRGLFVPAAACAAVAWGVARLALPGGWTGLAAAALAGGAAYGLVLYRAGSRGEERLFIDQLAGALHWETPRP